MATYTIKKMKESKQNNLVPDSQTKASYDFSGYKIKQTESEEVELVEKKEYTDEFNELLNEGTLDELKLTKDNLEKENENYNKEIDRYNQALDKLMEADPTNPDGLSLYTQYEMAINPIEKERLKVKVDEIILKELGITYDEAKSKISEFTNNIEINNMKIYKIDAMMKQKPYLEMMKTNEYQQFNLEINSELTNNFNNIISKYLTVDESNKVSINYDEFSKEYKEVDPATLAYLMKINNMDNIYISGANINNEKLKNIAQASQTDPNLLKLYQFIYKEKSIEEANNYLDNAKDLINQRAGEQAAKEFITSLSTLDDNVDITKMSPEELNSYLAERQDKALLNYLKVHGKGIGDGVTSSIEGLKVILSGLKNTDYTTNDYAVMYIMQELKNNNQYGLLQQYNYQLAQGVGNMLPSIVLSAIFTPAVGSLALGASVAGNAYKEMKNEGYSQNKAIDYAILNGISESLFQATLGGMPFLNDVEVTSFKTFIQSCFKEMGEEMLQQPYEILVNAAIKGEKIDLYEALKEIAIAGAYGFFTAGELQGASFPIQQSLTKTLENMGKINGIKDSSNAFEVEEKLIDKLENDYKKVDTKNKNMSPDLKILLESLNNTINNYKYENVLTNQELSNRVSKEGLYHFTTEEAAHKILENKYIKASNEISPFSQEKKSEFFAGTPTLENYITNCYDISDTLLNDGKAVAIKLDVEDTKIKDLTYRNATDNAITYDGNYELEENSNARIAYMGLVEEDGKLVWKEMSKEKWDNYSYKIDNNNIQNMIEYELMAIGETYNFYERSIAKAKESTSDEIVIESALDQTIDEQKQIKAKEELRAKIIQAFGFEEQDEPIVETIINAMGSKTISPETKKLLVNFSNLKEKFPEFKLYAWEQGSAFWGPFRTLGIDSKEAKLAKGAVPSVFFHELGHALLHLTQGTDVNLTIQLTQEQINLLNNARENLLSHPEIAAEVLKFAHEGDVTYNQTIEWYETVREEEESKTREKIALLLKNNDTQELSKIIKDGRLIGRGKRYLESVGMENSTVEEIIANKEILTNLAILQNEVEQLSYHQMELNSDYSLYGDNRRMSAMLNSLLMSITPIETENGEKITFTFGHGEPNYWTKFGEEDSYRRSYDELFADFTSLKMNGRTEALEMFRKFAGDALYDELDRTYKSIIDSLTQTQEEV